MTGSTMVESGTGLDWVTLPQAARLLRRTWPNLYKAVLRQEIEAIQIGGRWLVRRSSLDSLMAER